jgi:hypothetical protein
MKLVVRSVVMGLVFLALACSGPEWSGPAEKKAATVPAEDKIVAPALTDFACEISFVQPPSPELRVGGPGSRIRLKVTNSSRAAWPALLKTRSVINSVNVSYRWMKGTDYVLEGERALLTSDLGSGQSAELELLIRAPKDEGSYVLRVEPVQEAVAWFSNRTGCSVTAPVTVTPR